MKKFVNDKGKILPRRTTGACAKHQRDITLAIKRARQIAVLPYTQDQYLFGSAKKHFRFLFIKRSKRLTLFVKLYIINK